MSDGIYFWNYKWAADAGIETLACYVAGLDCGDHAIDPAGSVFVPWLSDPDGLFTRDYLINLSNNPPDGGFGASACNIDLTMDDDSLQRVVVDVAIGVPYRSEVQVLRPNSPDLSNSQYGPSLAELRRIHQYGVMLANAQGISVGTTEDNMRPVVFKHPNGDKYLDSELFTDVWWDVLDCDYDFDGMLMMQMFRPHPTTIPALIGFMKTFDRE